MSGVAVGPARVSAPKVAMSKAMAIAAALGAASMALASADFGVNVSVGALPARSDGYYVSRAYRVTVAGRPAAGAPVEVLKDGRPHAVVRAGEDGVARVDLVESGTYTVLFGRRRDRFTVSQFRAVKTMTIGGGTAEELHARPVWETDPSKRAGTYYVDHLVGGVLLRSAVRVQNEVIKTAQVSGLRLSLTAALARTFEPPAPRGVRASVVSGSSVLATAEAYGSLGGDISLSLSQTFSPVGSLRIFLCPMWHDGGGWRYSADEVVVKAASAEARTELGWVPARVELRRCTDYYSYCLQADLPAPTVYRVRTTYEPLQVPIAIDGLKPGDASKEVRVYYSAFEQSPLVGAVEVDGAPVPPRGAIEVVV